MLTYENCVEMLSRSRTGRKKLENNTYLTEAVTFDGTVRCFRVLLHNTAVVTVYRHGLYELDSGGYKSVTTKDHLKKYGPVSVHQKKGEWFVGPYGDVFIDGMIVMTSDARLKLTSVANLCRWFLDGDTPLSVVCDWLQDNPDKFRSLSGSPITENDIDMLRLYDRLRSQHRLHVPPADRPLKLRELVG